MSPRAISLSLFGFGLVLALALFGQWSVSPFGAASPPDAASRTSTPAKPNLQIEALRQATAGQLRVSYHSETGKVRFIGTTPGQPVMQRAVAAAGLGPAEAARGFMRDYGALFGVTDQANELNVKNVKSGDLGRSFVRFQQVHKGIPVLGGEVIVQTDEDANVVSANGELLPDLGISPAPSVASETARSRAIDVVGKENGLAADLLVASDPELWIYNPGLLGGRGPRLSSLVWRVEVKPVELLPIRELVLVDAHLGSVVLHFNQVPDAKDRRTYDAANGHNLPGTLKRTESQAAIGDADVDKAHNYAGDTYDFYQNVLGRDSIDNDGMTIISTVRYCPNSSNCPYQNAFWSGEQMVYGRGFASADDVVAHEISHGVTERESGLFYYMQSGAINEALSDIFGELVDLSNGKGNDAESVRWLLGEDVSIGAIRSLKNPPAYEDPDKVSSTYYYCGEIDGGGVHWNSGIANKAAYLMVDGGVFNGFTVIGLGIEKVAKIFYEVQTHLFTSASDYLDLYDGLQQACTDLIGTDGITEADCLQVKYAVEAVEMNMQPRNCAVDPAVACSLGQLPADVYVDDMETPSASRWVTGTIEGTGRWYYPQTVNIYDFDATYATSGQYNLWGDDVYDYSDYYIQMTSDVEVPANAYLRFNHAWTFDDYASKTYDGGVLEYSLDGGGNWSDAGPLFVGRGYNGILPATWRNPLAGRQAFVGESNGYTTSKVDLSSLAGQSVRFRFRIGTSDVTDANRYGAGYGWFVDDLVVYTCAPLGPYSTTLQEVQRSGVNSVPTRAATATPTTIPTATSTPAGSWQTIASTDFEGTFPGSWELWSVSGDTWDKRNCRPNAGGYSGWPVGGGTGSGRSCGSDYPSNANSWMIYGPFSLADATAAYLRFNVWLNSESGYDGLFFGASLNGDTFSGFMYSGDSGGWFTRTMDLANVYSLGNLRGQSSVWIALAFESDASVTYPEGAYVDNVVVRKYLAGSAPGLLATQDVEPLPASLREVQVEKLAPPRKAPAVR